MEKVIVAKSLKIEKSLFDAVIEAAKKDKRSVNSEIQVLIVEALESRKNVEKQ